GFDKSLYTSERIWINVKFGTKVPVSLVYRKDLWQKSKNPKLSLAKCIYMEYSIIRGGNVNTIRKEKTFLMWIWRKMEGIT
ncbi:MAG: hypothetical protein ACTS8P_06270, partial [Arsenophonus sp. NC-XBC3-MAG3]